MSFSCKTRILAGALGLSLLVAPLSVGAVDSSAEVTTPPSDSSEMTDTSELPEVPLSATISAVTADSPFLLLDEPDRDFSAAAQRLAELGYDSAAIRNIWAHVGEGLDESLEMNRLTATDLALLALPNSRLPMLQRYNAYARYMPKLPLSEVVAYVNAGRDMPFYEGTQLAPRPNDTLVLVNKTYALRADYVPELERLGTQYGIGSMRPEAAAAFRAMADAAAKDGISLRSVSAYRSYETQNSIYNKNLKNDKQEVVDTYSARPGYSEHQTGLAVDINSASTSAHFENTPAYGWLQKHCTEFGFILRYTKENAPITGYRFEPWHYRYIGVEHAKSYTKLGLSFEEYTALLPAGDYRPPVLLWQGAPLALEEHTLMLEGRCYVSAQSFVRAIGGQVITVDEWPAIVRGNDTVLLSSRRWHLPRNDRAERLDSPTVTIDGYVYLPLSSLCRLLDLKGNRLSGENAIVITEKK